jgi:hypothetical protein
MEASPEIAPVPFRVMLRLPALTWRVLLAALPRPAAAVAGTAGTFQVIDETDPQEISEDTVIFLNGKLVAHFRLDRSHTYSIAEIAAPAQGPYDYALCGRITVALPDGQQEQRVVDGGASLKDVKGHVFRALAANDFSIFYLADAQENPPLPPPDARHTDACSLPVS